MDKSDPRYIYHDYQQRQFASADELDGLLKIALHSGKSKIDAIIAGLKIGVVVVVMFARSKVIGDQMELKKQGYEIERDDRARENLDRDPLDAVRRPQG